MAVLGGAGAMGRATVFDLTQSGYRVRLLDSDIDAARRIGAASLANELIKGIVSEPEVGEIYEGKIEGALTWPPRGTMGFGYDPVFVPQSGSQMRQNVTFC